MERDELELRRYGLRPEALDGAAAHLLGVSLAQRRAKAVWRAYFKVRS